MRKDQEGVEITADNEIRGAFTLDNSNGGALARSLADAFRKVGFNVAVATSKGPIRGFFIQFDASSSFDDGAYQARVWQRIADALAPEVEGELPEVTKLRAQRDKALGQLATIERAMAQS